MHGLRNRGFAAGKTLADFEKHLFDVGARFDDRRSTSVAPIRTLDRTVPTDWVDYNGHTNDSRYMQLSSEGGDQFLRYIGLDQAYLESGRSYFTVESHINYIAQSRAGDHLYVTVQLLSHDAKRLHIFTAMNRADDDSPVATAEHMMLHVDSHAGKASPASPEIQATLAEIAAHHDKLPRPVQMPAARSANPNPAPHARTSFDTRVRNTRRDAAEWAGVEAGAEQTGSLGEPRALDLRGRDALGLHRQQRRHAVEQCGEHEHRLVGIALDELAALLPVADHLAQHCPPTPVHPIAFGRGRRIAQRQHAQLHPQRPVVVVQHRLDQDPQLFRCRRGLLDANGVPIVELRLRAAPTPRRAGPACRRTSRGSRPDWCRRSWRCRRLARWRSPVRTAPRRPR